MIEGKPIIFGLNRVLIIEIDATDEMRLNSCIEISKEKGEIKIEKTFSKLPEKLDLPVLLNISSSEIIEKTFSSLSDFQEFINNLQKDDFVIHDFNQADNNGIHLSFCRKIILDSVLESLLHLKDNFVGLCLGSSSLRFISKDSLKFEGNNIQSGTYEVSKFENSLKTQYKSAAHTLDQVLLYDDEVLAKHLLTYSIGIEFLTRGVERLYSTSYTLKTKDEQLYKLNTKHLIKYSLVSVFSLALINFAFFTYFHNQNLKIQGQFQSIMPLVEKNKALEKRNSELKDNLEQIIISNSSISHLQDRIVSMMPDQIELQKIVVFPLEESASFQDSERRLPLIRVKGLSPSPRYLTIWMDKLKDISLLKEIKLHRYEEKLRKGMPEFELILSI